MALTFPTNPTPGTTSNGGLSGGFQSWTWDGIAWKLAATPFVATSSTITSDMITNGTIVDADVSGTAAIALSKIQPIGGVANQFHVQNSANTATSVSLSGGDITSSVTTNALTLSIGTGAVTAAKTNFGGAWATQAITFSNISNGAGSCSVMTIGKTLFFRLEMTAGTVAADGNVTINLTGITFKTGTTQPVVAYGLTFGASQVTKANAQGGTTGIVIARTYTGATWVATDPVDGIKANGVVEIN